ncbi:transgelin-2-like [Aquarana catesbeiana]|uniref:transgelin-2-like n=1 Tax=Aquarana catesbeiana TaxID=8400 RepID=UPI003CCA5FF4
MFFLAKTPTTNTYKMANKGPSYGLSREDQLKIDQKYDPELENILVQWISAQCNNKVGEPEEAGQIGFQKWLKDGVILCYLINSLAPGSVSKIQSSNLPFKQIEQVSQFLKACEKYGIAAADQFQTADLWEGKDMTRVQQTLKNLGSLAVTKGDGHFKGDPNWFPKKSMEIKRGFTQDKLKEGQSVIGL